MTQWIRETFEKVFKKEWESMDMHTVYGICHNVVKLEEYSVDGKKRKLFVHRKRGGCSRCGQLIAKNREFWGEDQIWIGKENGRSLYMTYKEGLKRAKN